MVLASTLWNHSKKNMNLNYYKVALLYLYSGYFLYSLNSVSHSSIVYGYFNDNGFQYTIDSPAFFILVYPPINIIRTTHNAHPINQQPTNILYYGSQY